MCFHKRHKNGDGCQFIDLRVLRQQSLEEETRRLQSSAGGSWKKLCRGVRSCCTQLFKISDSAQAHVVSRFMISLGLIVLMVTLMAAFF